MNLSEPFVRGLLLVAALGDAARHSIVRASLNHFDQRSWDCIAYAHAASGGATFEHCLVVRRLGWGWASLLNLTRLGPAHSHVFVLLDDVLLPRATFRTQELLRTMQRHRLSVVQPTLRAAACTDLYVACMHGRCSPRCVAARMPPTGRSGGRCGVRAACGTWPCSRSSPPFSPPPRGAACTDLIYILDACMAGLRRALYRRRVALLR